MHCKKRRRGPFHLLTKLIGNGCRRIAAVPRPFGKRVAAEPVQQAFICRYLGSKYGGMFTKSGSFDYE
jgi:uncharacterized protein (DUF697 family)